MIKTLTLTATALILSGCGEDFKKPKAFPLTAESHGIPKSMIL